ncbi:MAG: SbcC/MukB-like Walker B domain-containing protein, partial [Alphaproteobacteria bacterium]
TQLNYNQFLRSVMLAQGEFAAFLSANAKDKGTLLEQITGEEIYKKIGEAINDKIYEERKKLDNIKAKINTEDLLTDEKRKELIEEQNTLSEKINALNTELKGIDRIINWYKKNVELIKTQHQLEKELDDLENKNEENQEILEVLELHEKAEPYKEAVYEIVRSEKEINKKKGRLLKLTIEIDGISTKLAEAQKQEEKNKEIHFQKESELKLWLPKLEQVTKLDTEISHILKAKEKTNSTINELSNVVNRIQKNIKQKEQERKQKETVLIDIEAFLKENNNVPEIEKKINLWNSKLTLRKSNRERISEIAGSIHQSEKELKLTKADLEKTKEDFEKENIKIDKLKERIAELSELLQSFDLENLLEKQKQLEARKSNLKELQNLSTNYIDFNQKKNELGKEKDEFEKKKKEFSGNITKLQSEIVVAEKSLQDAESILELERTIKSFDEERNKLEKGKPCSLCGSKAHPYVEKYLKIELSKSQAEVENRKLFLEKLKMNEKSIEINFTKTKTKLESNLSQAKNIQQQIEETLSKFNEIKEEFIIEDTQAIITMSVALSDELTILTNNITETQKLQKQKDVKDKLFNSEKEKANNLENEIVKLREKSKGIKVALLQKNEDLKKINLETEEMETSLEKELSDYNLMTPSTENTSKFLKQLENKISSFHSNNKELLKVKNAISQLLSDIKNSKNQREEKTGEKEKQEEEIRKLNDKLSRISENRNSILPLGINTDKKRDELQKAIKITKEELDKVTHYFNDLKTKKATKEKEKENLVNEWNAKLKELNTASLAFDEKIKNSIFGSRQEIEEVLLSFDDKTEYSGIKKQLENKALELKTLEAKLKEDFIKQEKERDFETSYDEAQEKHAEIESSKEKLLERTGEIKKQFELDNQIKERNKGVFDNISALEKVLKKWTDLITLLGGSKHTFNTYVQRLTLQNLIQLANIHLYKLNRRYSLKMNETYKSGEELNFMLIDHYQTDEARLVDTSSGGEKFLISLALALGLSDLASNNVSIESLFIDEGFGTLDNNALETVISTLETLHAQGKMIGVISHVENLKERIPTQIQVLKKTNGVSEVEII